MEEDKKEERQDSTTSINTELRQSVVGSSPTGGALE